MKNIKSNKNRIIKCLLSPVFLTLGLFIFMISAQAETNTLEEFEQAYSQVELSPNREGWTIPGTGTAERYAGLTFKLAEDGISYDVCATIDTNGDGVVNDDDLKIRVGRDISLKIPSIGQHVYYPKVTGNVDISYWQLIHPDSVCTHGHEFVGDEFVGIDIAGDICWKAYDNGWWAICADCGEPVYDMIIYAHSEQIKNISTMVGESAYYYLCPFSQSLEQGTRYKHACRDVSSNRYMVIYISNAPEGVTVGGKTASTYHMYNNDTVYRGAEATYKDTKLRKNGFFLQGYIFKGWNTEADGSGDAYTDEQAVLNLTDINDRKVILFAQWEKIETTITIDGNGGLYDGEAVCSVTKPFGTYLTLIPAKVQPPAGYTVHFNTDGGTSCADIHTTKSFSHWEPQPGFEGTLRNNVYEFSSLTERHVDVIKVQYLNNTFILPDTTKENVSLAGWYYDAALQNFCGRPGDEVAIDGSLVTNGSVTLYAKWVTLALYGKEIESTTHPKGAVDLWWEQNDGKEKIYKVYQSLQDAAAGNFGDWKLLSESGSALEAKSIEKTFSNYGTEESFTVTETGYYTLSVYGGKGADYAEGLPGGNGGAVSATFWLKKGDVLFAYVGGAGYGQIGGTNGNGADGGNATNEAARGGGAASELYISRDGGEPVLLLTGGGGGGANANLPGGHGGAGEATITDKTGESTEQGGGGGGYGGGTVIATEFSGNQSWDFAYTGTVEAFTAPYSTVYTLEAWGAQGGGSVHGGAEQWGNKPGGYGGYSTGQVKLTAGQTVYLAVGGSDNAYIGGLEGFNGGGSGKGFIPGGGATHFAVSMQGDGLLADYESYQSDVLLVAGGGGGAGNYGSATSGGGAGGGTTGTNGSNGGSYKYDSTDNCGFYHTAGGGSQEAGGNMGSYGYGSHQCTNGWVNGFTWKGSAGSFGQGASPGGSNAGGGGGGWYGGGAGAGSAGTYPGGGGGSGHIGDLILEGSGSMETGIWGSTALNTTPTLNGKAAISCEVIQQFYMSGGSNYISTTEEYRVKDAYTAAGVNEGNGFIRITSVSVGYHEDAELKDVSAPDVQAPYPIDEDAAQVMIQSLQEDKIHYRIYFEKSEDRSTRYGYRVESYEMPLEGKMSVSNEICIPVTSGYGGVYYYIDKKASGKVNSSHNFLTAERNSLTYIGQQSSTDYLHIAAVDKAGNISVTTTLELSPKKANGLELFIPIIDSIDIKVSAFNDVQEWSPLYAKDGVYYVRADGKTNFTIPVTAHIMDNMEREDYQVNTIHYNVLEADTMAKTEWFSGRVDNGWYVDFGNSQIVLDSKQNMQFTESAHATASRTGTGELLLHQDVTFLPTAESNRLVIYPSAYAEMVKDGEPVEVASEDADDRGKQITVITDGTPPEITGLEELIYCDIINMAETKKIFTLTASDAVSGLQQFEVTIKNTDNYIRRTIRDEDDGVKDGKIIIEVPQYYEGSKEGLVFYGNFGITVQAVDNVGNVIVEKADSAGAVLQAELKRILSPHTPIFKAGESGILSIAALAYVEKVEVTFPSEMLIENPGLNQKYIYTQNLQHRQQEELEFMIPLYCLPGEYQIIVRGYKQGTNLEMNPKRLFLTVQGSVLDELRTRLR